MLISSEGNDKYVKQELSDSSSVLGKIYMLYINAKPLKNDQDELVGSKLEWISSMKFGGYVPQWIANTIGSSVMIDSIRSCIAHVKTLEASTKSSPETIPESTEDQIAC